MGDVLYVVLTGREKDQRGVFPVVFVVAALSRAELHCSVVRIQSEGGG